MEQHKNYYFIDYQDPLAILSDPDQYALMQQELNEACNQVGENVRVGRITVWGGKSENHRGLRLGNDVNIYSGCRLVTDLVIPTSGIVLSDGVAINFNAYLEGSGGIFVGKNTIMGPNVVILSSSHERVFEQNFDRSKKEYMQTTIGDNVWIGANAVIMPGISIGDSCIIAAGSVVTRDVPARTKVAGIPATKI